VQAHQKVGDKRRLRKGEHSDVQRPGGGGSKDHGEEIEASDVYK